MNSLMISALVAVVWIFHRRTGSLVRRGKVKTAFCAKWCIDSVFALCGTVISFLLYRYGFEPYLTLRNGMLVLGYLLLTFLFVWVTPSGLSLLKVRRGMEEEEISMAEYALNDTLETVRNCFLVLLFLLPFLFAEWSGAVTLQEFFAWREAEVCGGLCFVAFLLLVPMCLRQALYWLRNLTPSEEKGEEQMLEQYRMKLQYGQRNFWL